MRDHSECEEAIAEQMAAGNDGRAEFLAARCDLKHGHIRDALHPTTAEEATT